MFTNVTFARISSFKHATFITVAQFDNAIFVRTAWFYKSRFEVIGDFSEAEFQSSAIFEAANFGRNATFNSAKSDGPFSLTGARFDQVPDFIQMSFRAPARLDNLEINLARPFLEEGDRNRAARYRAHKKLAIESRDHVREQSFFASEVKERRGSDDPIWSPSFVLGFIYEFLSDFGPSIATPFFWWLGSTFAFWLIYLARHNYDAEKACGPEPTQPLVDSLYLSLKSALLVIGWERSQKLNQVYACLFGGSAKEPNIPTAISFLQMSQTLWSAILLFLFFLALRNHFTVPLKRRKEIFGISEPCTRDSLVSRDHVADARWP